MRISLLHGKKETVILSVSPVCDVTVVTNKRSIVFQSSLFVHHFPFEHFSISVAIKEPFYLVAGAITAQLLKGTLGKFKSIKVMIALTGSQQRNRETSIPLLCDSNPKDM